jgi:hypothetical protein
MPIKIDEKVMLSPHYSTSRGPYNKVVLHTTEGADTITALGNWFQNPDAQCSSHHGADNYSATFGAYVYENYKAWTQGNANPYCLSLELCGYASWSRDKWLTEKIQLINNAAHWVAYCVDKYDIPWKVLSDAEAQNPDIRGINQHLNFGAWGSGHVDCGRNTFPMDVVIDKAMKWGIATIPEVNDMSIGVTFYQGEKWYAGIGSDNRVYWSGPDTDYKWHMVDTNSRAFPGSGANIAINEGHGGAAVITYVNHVKEFCAYNRPPDGGAWQWQNLNGHG